MGIGCVLFLWAAVALIAVLMASVGVFFILRGKKAVGFVMAAIGSTAALAAIAFIVMWLYAFARPRTSSSPETFQAAFGFAPGADVTDLNSRLSQSTDFQLQLIHFRASPQTIADITHTRFKKAPPSECAQAMRQVDDPPQWWTPSPSATCSVAEPFDHAFATNTAWLTYDASSRDAHFVYQGVD